MSSTSTETPKRVILITGATGKQGGATIDALIEAGAHKTHTLLAVTRNPHSEAGKKLEARGVMLIEGDLNDVPVLFNRVKAILGGRHASIWGVFSVQVFDSKHEETQGKALVDAALAHNVEYFVYTSVDRGGEARSPSNQTNVPHFMGKYNIEKHLLAATGTSKGDKMKWVILRPVFFMENMEPGFPAKVMGTALKAILKQKPLQFVSCRDIGWYAAQAFLKPEEFVGRSISLAGDSLTFAQANDVFQAKVGKPLPQTLSLITNLVMLLAGDLGKMVRWFAAEGYGADIKALRVEHPELQSFGDWLDESDWVKTKKSNSEVVD